MFVYFLIPRLMIVVFSMAVLPIPSETTVMKTPSEMTATAIPSETTVMKTPSEMAATAMPSEITVMETPSEITATAMPSEITATAIPSGMAATAIPSGMAATAMPSGIDATAMPSKITATALPSEMTATAIPSGIAAQVLSSHQIVLHQQNTITINSITLEADVSILSLQEQNLRVVPNKYRTTTLLKDCEELIVHTSLLTENAVGHTKLISPGTLMVQ